MKCPNKSCHSTKFIVTDVKKVGNHIVRTKMCVQPKCLTMYNTVEMIVPFEGVIKIIPGEGKNIETDS